MVWSSGGAGSLVLLALGRVHAGNVRGLAANCPKYEQTPFLAEPSPFGWPLTPNDFVFTDTGAWNDKYLFCAGERQSPIDVSVGSATCPVTSQGGAGVMATAARYKASEAQTVQVSKYMRTAYVSGNFGSLMMQDLVGHDVEYEAIQVHVTSPSLHTVSGKQYDAEMHIVHKPKNQKDMLRESIITSVLFSYGGDSSIFDHMGFTSTGEAMPEATGASWTPPHYMDLPMGLGDALSGSSYHYNGSVPVPPCSENVKWIVMASVQSVGPQQVKKLQDMLECYAGGTQKRGPRANPYLGTCRAIEENSIKVGGSFHNDTCLMALKNGTSKRSAVCWETGLSAVEREQCEKSPVDISSTEAYPIGDGFQPVINLTDARDVLVVPGNYSLDVTAPDHAITGELGDFGTLMVNGRGFKVRKISIKAVSSHTWDGMRMPGELQIEGVMYGDEYAGNWTPPPVVVKNVSTHLNASNSSNQSNLSNTTVAAHAAAGHRQLSDVMAPTMTAPPSASNMTVDRYHRVILSIPLKLGAESQLLRELGLPFEAYKAAIRQGSVYTIENMVHVQKGLGQPLAGSFVFYSGGMTTPGCPEWGVRWLVYQTPLEVSLAQLNFLALKVSGVDSSRLVDVIPMPSLYKYRQSLPKTGVDHHATCSPSRPWDYADPSCWPQFFPKCDAGMRQSPINIVTSAVTTVGKDNFLAATSWKPVSHLQVLNNGNTLQIANQQLGYVTLIGPDGFPEYYSVTSIVLHMPSEHFIDGRQFAAELHVVHRRQKYVAQLAGALEEAYPLVTAFLFDIGTEDSMLLKQFHLPDMVTNVLNFQETKRPVDLMRSLGPALDGDYYRYNGSLTTPSCTEASKWFVFSKVFSMSRKQWSTFKVMFPNPGNNRPVQPTHGRLIAKNSFEDSEPLILDNYLGRHFGRDRLHPSTAWILVPIIAALSLLSCVMASIFVREGRKTQEQAGGLAKQTTIGRGTYNKM